MNYYIMVYKKEIYTIGGIFLSIVVLLGLWMVYKKYENPVRKVNIQTTKENNLVYDENKMNMDTYNYYQLYVFPSKYEIICESEEKGICENIEKNKDIISSYQLGFFGKDIQSGEKQQQEVKTLVSNKQNHENILKDIIIQSYVGNTQTRKETGYEKYFEYKKQDGENIVLNDMEIMCVEQVRQSIPSGSFDEENIIKQKVLEQCQSFSNINPIDFALGGVKENNTTIKLQLKITELKLDYRFFKKTQNEFISKLQEQKYISFDVLIEHTFKMNEILP